MSLNKVVITGEILEDPETRYTNADDAITRLFIRTGDDIKLRVACWRALSEKAKELKANDIIIVIGSLITSSYKTNTGVNRKDFEVNARELYQLSSIPESLNPFNSTGNKSNANNVPSGARAPKIEKEEDLSDILISDEEIPF